MRKTIIASALILLIVGVTAPTIAQEGREVSTGDVTEWSSLTEPDPVAGIFPVEGDGQLNGEFTIADRDGAQIALRATDRTDGLLDVTLDGKKGRYVAATGTEAAGTRAEWNYDIHVDLRGTGTSLGDYDLTLSQNFTPILFGSVGPLDLTFDGAVPDHAELLQISWNPVFGNETFDPFLEDTYTLKLTLKPKDGGSPLRVQIEVDVQDI